MPEYIWEFVCGCLADGRYTFPEGTVVVKNGFVGWYPSDKETTE